MLEEIKKVSNLVSEQMAKAYLQKPPHKLRSGEGAISPDLNRLVGSICEKYEIIAHHGPVQSGTETPTGQHVDFVAFTKSFWKYAPELTEFISNLSRSIIVEIAGNNIKIRSGEESDKPEPCRSGYFVQGEEIYAVDLANGKLYEWSGSQTGGASKSDDGTIIVDLNIESNITTNDLIHELIHAKLPEEMQQKHIPHHQIDAMANEVEGRLKIPMRSPISEIAYLRDEQLKILKIFEKFDKDLRKLMFANRVKKEQPA